MILVHLLCTNVLIFFIYIVLRYSKNIHFDLISFFTPNISIFFTPDQLKSIYFNYSLNRGCEEQCLSLGVFSQALPSKMNEWKTCADWTIITATTLGLRLLVMQPDSCLYEVSLLHWVISRRWEGKKKKIHILPQLLTRGMTLCKLLFVLL